MLRSCQLGVNKRDEARVRWRNVGDGRLRQRNHDSAHKQHSRKHHLPRQHAVTVSTLTVPEPVKRDVPTQPGVAP
jgi:hypothetical protein